MKSITRLAWVAVLICTLSACGAAGHSPDHSATEREVTAVCAVLAIPTDGAHPPPVAIVYFLTDHDKEVADKAIMSITDDGADARVQKALSFLPDDRRQDIEDDIRSSGAVGQVRQYISEVSPVCPDDATA